MRTYDTSGGRRPPEAASSNVFRSSLRIICICRLPHTCHLVQYSTRTRNMRHRVSASTSLTAALHGCCSTVRVAQVQNSTWLCIDIAQTTHDSDILADAILKSDDEYFICRSDSISPYRAPSNICIASSFSTAPLPCLLSESCTNRNTDLRRSTLVCIHLSPALT